MYTNNGQLTEKEMSTVLKYVNLTHNKRNVN